MSIKISSMASIQGGRQHQEDGFGSGSKCAYVADGLGGHAHGTEAASTAIAAVAASLGAGFTAGGALMAAAEAVESLRPYTARRYEDIPGTTLNVATWQGDVVSLATIGDSPVYHVHDGRAWMVAGHRDTSPGGSISACLGAGFPLERIAPHLDTIHMVPGDSLILTTDGCDPYFRHYDDPREDDDALAIVTESVRLSGARADNASAIVLVCHA